MRGRGCFLSLYICAVAGAFYPYIYALIYSTTYIYFCTKKPPKQAAAELFCEIVVNLHCVYQVNGYAGKKSVSNKKAQTAILKQLCLRSQYYYIDITNCFAVSVPRRLVYGNLHSGACVQLPLFRAGCAYGRGELLCKAYYRVHAGRKQL